MSDCSSNIDNDDNGGHQQSTKERRRERNRLAAQKHRLRRNERMSQLEQQVLALQQEKSILLARIDGNSIIPSSASSLPPAQSVEPLTPPASAGGSSQDDDADDGDDDPPPQHYQHYHHYDQHPPPLSMRSRSSLSPSPSLPPLQTNFEQRPTHVRTQLPPIDDALAHHGPNAAYTRRLEDRIIELERWTEELNGELADALDSHSRISSDLQRRTRRALDQLAAAESQRAAAQREQAALRAALDERDAELHEAHRAAQGLREQLEGVEVTLDLQRAENDRLRDRLTRTPSSASPPFEPQDSHYGANPRKRKLFKLEDSSVPRLPSPSSLAGPGAPSAHPYVLSSHSHPYYIEESSNRSGDHRRLNERVDHLQHALHKASSFLLAKGVDVRFDELSGDEQ